MTVRERGTSDGLDGRDDLRTTLIMRLRGGDEEAGRLLDALYRDVMLRFCRGYLHSDSAAEDAVQEVFTKVLTTAVVPDSFRAWIYSIARNHCLDQLRRQKHRPAGQGMRAAVELIGRRTGVGTRLARHDAQAEMLQALDRLSEPQREVLRLRYTEGLTRAEIGEVLGIPEKLVRSRLFDGMQHLRRHLAERSGET